MASVGRNDPCPCGSGKKHKKCCLQRVDVVERTRRLRSVARVAGVEILTFAYDEIGEHFLDEAWATLWSSRDETPPYGGPIEPLFVVWMSYLLRPSGAVSVAERYAAEGKDVRVEISDWIELAVRAPLSYFEIIDVSADAVQVRDQLRGTGFTVHEPLPSGAARPGQSVFGRIVEVGATAIFEGVGPTPIDAAVADAVLSKLRARFDSALQTSVDTETLLAGTDTLIASYLEMLS